MDKTLVPEKMVVLTLSVLTLLCSWQDFAFAGETTDITGTITARRQGAVKVEFKANPKAGPKVGDKVDFKTMMQGFEAKAGKGEVMKVEASHVWVKVLEKNPRLKMTGIIHATGLPGPEEKTFDIKSFDKFNIKDPGATLKIRFPGGWEFKMIGSDGRVYKMKSEGVDVTLDASAFYRYFPAPVANNSDILRVPESLRIPASLGKRPTSAASYHKGEMELRRDVFDQDDKWEPVWENRKLNESSNCLADHVLTTDSLGTHRRMRATCVDPNARPSSNGEVQVYELEFLIDKRQAGNKKTHKHWSAPWEDWFVKAVQSFSIEAK
jgi:hypothetical protein